MDMIYFGRLRIARIINLGLQEKGKFWTKPGSSTLDSQKKASFGQIREWPEDEGDCLPPTCEMDDTETSISLVRSMQRIPTFW
jgi:hypothetical protein